MSEYRIQKRGGLHEITTARPVDLGVESRVLKLSDSHTEEEAITKALHALDSLINRLAIIRLELMDKVPISKGGRRA